MCLGIPMRVIEAGGGRALCEGRGERREIDTLLIGDPPVGAVVLVHLDMATGILDETDAELINLTLDAVEAALRGEPVESFFPDLENGGLRP